MAPGEKLSSVIEFIEKIDISIFSFKDLPLNIDQSRYIFQQNCDQKISYYIDYIDQVYSMTPSEKLLFMIEVIENIDISTFLFHQVPPNIDQSRYVFLGNIDQKILNIIDYIDKCTQ